MVLLTFSHLPFNHCNDSWHAFPLHSQMMQHSYEGSLVSSRAYHPCGVQVDTVEVWLTLQPEKDTLTQKHGNSALDRFKEDRNFLEMAGKTVQASRGYREAPPEDDL